MSYLPAVSRHRNPDGACSQIRLEAPVLSGHRAGFGEDNEIQLLARRARREVIGDEHLKRPSALDAAA